MTDRNDDRTAGTLEREELGDDPIETFRRWLIEAEADSVLNYPNACTLSTVGSDGMPAGRIVLLKGLDERGFRFFTNYRSAKGEALQVNPKASLTFYWDAMGRQVRVRGTVERLSDAESDAYFASRPVGSRLGAWASDQSRPLESREALRERLESMRERFGEDVIPRPPHWGGYRVHPLEIEFWSAGDARLHDRFVFRRAPGSDHWSVVRLNP